MISQPSTLLRIGKIGKPYVQSTDPSFTHTMIQNDLWLNPTAGTMKMWNGTGWEEMQFGESSFMDDCITNRLLANDISASKITAGILKSQDESFYLNLETGEAELLNLIMGGEINGNIIAMSSNGLTRVRLRGREGDRDVTAGIIFEERADEESEWVNAGQIYFAYSTRRTYAALHDYQIGAYNSNRPNTAYNAGSDDGLVIRAISTNWLRLAVNSYHGSRLQKRDTINDSFADVTPVLNCIGNCVYGTAIAVNGIVTCTYKYNDIMQLDFNLKVTTSGSGTAEFGISRNLLRQLNAEVPVITPIDGGNLSIYTSSGALSTGYVGATMKATSVGWRPAYINGSSITALNESAMTNGLTLIGTCYGKYDITEI